MNKYNKCMHTFILAAVEWRIFIVDLLCKSDFYTLSIMNIIFQLKSGTA